MTISKKIKVCILTTVHPLTDTRIFHKQAKSLARVGYEVTLVARHDRDEIVDGIRVVALPNPASRIQRMTKTAWHAYKLALKNNADIYHFHDPELIPIGLLLKLHGKRVIYDVHEDVPRQNLSKHYIPAIFRKPLSLMIETLEAFSACRFNAVITATPFINERFLKLGAHAININNYPRLSEMCFNDIPWVQKEKAFCYIGVITEIRGAFEMLGAIEKIKCSLLLAGNITSRVEGGLKKMHGWRYVEALGHVSRTDVQRVMARSLGGFVLFHPAPNHINAQPNKLFEYMSASIPVIASNFLLWKEIVEGLGCGICVDPLNPEEIARACRQIMANPEEAERMGKNGRRAVKEKYNWEIESEKLLTLYQRILES